MKLLSWVMLIFVDVHEAHEVEEDGTDCCCLCTREVVWSKVRYWMGVGVIVDTFGFLSLTLLYCAFVVVVVLQSLNVAVALEMLLPMLVVCLN